MIFYLPKKIVMAAIRMYQRTLSPDHGLFRARHPHGFCKFYPTCSEYAYETVEKFGVIKGSWLGLKRVARCNPWSRSGVDLVPNP